MQVFKSLNPKTFVAISLILLMALAILPILPVEAQTLPRQSGSSVLLPSGVTPDLPQTPLHILLFHLTRWVSVKLSLLTYGFIQQRLQHET